MSETRRLRETPSQTAGPYVHIGCTPSAAGIHEVYPEDPGARMVGPDTAGERIAVAIRVFDGAGAPVRDAVVEIWQADAAGLYPGRGERRGDADPHFTGWGRRAAGEDGALRFETIKPGRVPYADGRPQAPHLQVWIVARGINLGLHTRMYFADEAAANAEDPVLCRVDVAPRATTLVAVRDGGGYRFDIHLQGPAETVFFDI